MKMDYKFRLTGDRIKIPVEQILKEMKNPVGISGFKNVVEQSEHISWIINDAAFYESTEDEKAIVPERARNAYSTAKKLVERANGLEWAELIKEPSKRPFTSRELMLYFAGSSTNYATRTFNHPHEYWLPLILWQTGARPNEICQMNVPDIREEDGVLVFSIEGDEDDNGENAKEKKKKTVKNGSSIRDVPVSKTLINLGLLDYVDSIKSKGGRLFPEISTGSIRPYASISQKMNKTLTDCGITKKNKNGEATFYCFRHTFKTELAIANVRKAISCLITGEALSKDDMDRSYIRSITCEKKKQSLESIEWPKELIDAIPKWQDVDFRNPIPPRPGKFGKPSSNQNKP